MEDCSEEFIWGLHWWMSRHSFFVLDHVQHRANKFRCMRNAHCISQDVPSFIQYVRKNGLKMTLQPFYVVPSLVVETTFFKREIHRRQKNSATYFEIQTYTHILQIDCWVFSSDGGSAFAWVEKTSKLQPLLHSGGWFRLVQERLQDHTLCNNLGSVGWKIFYLLEVSWMTLLLESRQGKKRRSAILWMQWNVQDKSAWREWGEANAFKRLGLEQEVKYKI